MTPWEEINEAIAQFVLHSQSRGQRIFLVVDELFWDQIGKSFEQLGKDILATAVTYLHQDWYDPLRTSGHPVPPVLPLIAIQLYAAHQMRRDMQYTENAYLPRLLKLLGRDNDSNWIQQQFSFHQDWAWKKAKSFFEIEGYEFELPLQREGKGRYVQFPLSHALLNRADLDSISHFFSEAKILPHHRFSFREFCGMVSLDSIAYHSKTTRHFKKVISNPEKENLALQQIYSWFIDWPGTPTEIYSRTKKAILSAKRKTHNDKSLILEANHESKLYRLRLLDTNDQEVWSHRVDNLLFQELNKRYPIRELVRGTLFFQWDQRFQDFEWSRNLVVDQKFAIIFDLDRSEKHYFPKAYFPDTEEVFVGCKILIVTLTISEQNEKHIPHSWIRGKHTTPSLKNGIRVGRNMWLHGGGPELILPSSVEFIFVDGKRHKIRKRQETFDLSKLSIGEHSIAVPQQFPLKFSIVSPRFDPIEIKENIGWNLGNLQPINERTDLCGCLLTSSPIMPENEPSSPIRNWIDLITKNRKPSKSLSIVEKAIARKKYGI